MLAGFVLRSPHAHAKIISIDTSEAEATPGVHAVITNAGFNVENKIADLGEGSVNLSYLSTNCMAQQKVLYRICRSCCSYRCPYRRRSSPKNQSRI